MYAWNDSWNQTSKTNCGVLRWTTVSQTYLIKPYLSIFHSLYLYSDAVDPTHCFWVSLEYHRQAVEYICSHAPPPSNVGRADDDTVTIDTDNVLNGITSDYSLQ